MTTASVAALLMSGCAPGSLDDESESDEEVDSEDTALSVNFQLPFLCGQTWEGQSRTNHSPQFSLDFNRTDDFGDAVVAAAKGTVTRVGNEGNTSYGRWIEIDHGSGYRTRYAHLSKQLVSVGQSVAQGKKIGEVGNSGGSSGSHLHYEQRLNGVAQKPTFDGKLSYFFGSKSYKSKNNCGGGGGGATGTINTNGASLTVRSKPSTSGNDVGSVADGQVVTITCQVHGSSVSGTYGTSTLWDFIGTGYVADAYVSTGSDGQVAPTCK